MKKSSSSNTRMWELFPLLISNITVPDTAPCLQHNNKNSDKNIYKQYLKQLTTAMAVMDSLTHRFSSSKWPITKQRQRMTMNTEIGITWGCSVASSIDRNSGSPIPIFLKRNKLAMIILFFFFAFVYYTYTNRKPKQAQRTRERQSQSVRDLNCVKQGGCYMWR